MEYKAQCGDIFLCDSDRTGAKIVKFFMTAPTVWQHLWRKFRGTQEIVRYYHAGMILSDEQMIEQQGKVQYGKTQKILSRKISIYRYKISDQNNFYYGIPIEQRIKQLQDLLKNRAIEDLGKGYDILQIVGKTLTWLTGIKLFVRVLGGITREEEICVTRDADWYWPVCQFGCKTKSELTTKIMDEYCLNHPEEWEVVYIN